MSRRKDRKRRRDRDTFAVPRPADPPHPAVLALSEKHGPPKVDLRQAELRDGIGFNTGGYAKRPIAHGRPWCVSRADLDYYPRVFSFMLDEPASLLFYLYPVALEHARDAQLEATDSLLYTLDTALPELLPLMDDADRAAFAEGLVWIHDAHGPDDAPFRQCPNLVPLLRAERAAAADR